MWVAGEISGVRLANSGHYYFTLKDQEAQIRCVCYRLAARYLRFKPQDGVAVLARGRLDVYAPRGEYQLIVETLEPQGLGALQLAFEQLKNKLAAEGLFAAARKRPLPKYPGRIGIVTSLDGAVIRDILHVLGRRFPGLHVRIFPAQVQGPGSVEEVVRAVDWFSASGWPDVVIVARGGGSLEDLWTFNEEAVARAIARSKVPVISAIGHETDYTIADFVADVRAPTPSAAAEMVIAPKQQLLGQVAAAQLRLEQAVRYRLAQGGRRLHELSIDRPARLLHRLMGRRQQRLDELDGRLRQRWRELFAGRRSRWQALDERLRRLDVRLRLAAARRRLDELSRRSEQSIHLRLTRVRARLESLRAELGHLSPLAVLERGYAIVRDEAGRVIKDAATVAAGTLLQILLARGRLRARATEPTPDDSSALPS
ncbi:MAG: exodeoxyribonuclease VII large subunit [Bryobacteraceae bacterium]|nr:exodeoxyribonuclease VII large subunit [Bryobacteraceae bacterium]